MTNLEILNSFAISLLKQNTLDDLLWSMATDIGELLGFEDCVIYLKEDNLLVQSAAYGIKNPNARVIRNRIQIKLGEGIVGTVANSGEFIYVADLSKDKRYIPDEFSGKSELTVPLKFENKVIGVLDTESPRKNGFSKWDIDMLHSLANIAAPRINAAISQIEKVHAQENLRESKRIEEALRESEARLEDAQRLAKIGHWDWDEIANKYITCSEQLANIFDMTVEQMLENVTNDDEDRKLVHEDDRERYIQITDAAWESKQGWDIEYRANDKAGKPLYIREICKYVFDDHGEIIRSIGTVQDITEKKQTEEALKLNHALYRQAEAMGNMGHWCWDYEVDRLVSCSDQFARIYGMTVPEALDRFISTEAELDFVHPEDKELFKQAAYATSELYRKFDVEYRIITTSGDTRHVYARNELVFNSDGELSQSFGTIQDITDRKKNEEKLSYQASHDTLTGLINRSEFEQRTNRLLTSIQKDKTEHAMCFLDLDQFKIINDTCGHVAGDELLRQLGVLFTSVIRKQDTLARLGGDEFGLLMEHCSLDQARRVAGAILFAIKNYQFFWEEKTFRIGVSIGLVAITEASGNFTEVFKQADTACYLAKDLGRNRIHAYHPDDTELADRHGEMQWVGRIHQALDDDRYCLYAQPIVPLVDSEHRHYEILLRMIDETGEVVPPGAFLPAAERYDLMGILDRWVIESAFVLLAENPSFVDRIRFISINLSGQSLTSSDFLDFIRGKIKNTGIEANKVCFEITETLAISNLVAARRFINILKGLGCQFALDDFGSGLSSFGYLKNLPVDYLKIDGMFVKDIVDDPIDHAMVKSINEIGQVMGMQTIAEFVENDAIKTMLGEIGVDYVQGYGVGMPLPFNEIVEQTYYRLSKLDQT